MGSFSDSILEETAEWIQRQHLFFVATVPLDGAGHVNVSSNGLDSCAIVSPHRVAYLDLSRSAAETVAHVRENVRLTVMFVPSKETRTSFGGSSVAR